MNTRRVVAAVAGVAIAASILTASPASATLGGGDTQVTFNLLSGSLSIQVSGTQIKNLANKTPDGTTAQFSDDLLATTVTDNRNSLLGYQVSANCDDFSDGSGHTIPKAKVKVAVPVLNVGNVTVAGATLSNLQKGNLFVPSAGVTCGASAGAIANQVGGTTLTGLLGVLGLGSTNNAATYTPQITVTVPADTPDGTYTSVVYQTVA